MTITFNLLDARIRNMEDLALRLERRVTALEALKGAPGSGACICKMSPEERERTNALQGTTWAEESKSRFPTHALIDHRCPKHGERAQPALWGRHKEKELLVSYAQWSSLGVNPYSIPPPPDGPVVMLGENGDAIAVGGTTTDKP